MMKPQYQQCIGSSARRSKYLQLMASVASISLASLAPTLLPSSALADCREPNGRFVVNGGSNCPTTRANFATTNQNQNTIDVGGGLGTITNGNVNITGGSNAERAIFVRSANDVNGRLVINGNTNIIFNSTNAAAVAAIDLRASSTIEINGGLNITSNAQGIQTINRSRLVVNGDIVINSATRGVNVRDVDAVNEFRSETVTINTSGDDGVGLNVGTRGQILIGITPQTSPDLGASAIVSKSTDLRVTTLGDDASAIAATYDNTNVLPASNAIIVIDRAVVRTSGDNSEGIYAQLKAGSGSASVEAENVDIVTLGENSDGIVAAVSDGSFFGALNGNSSVVMKSGSVSTSGDGSAGLIAQTDLSFLGSSTGNASVIMSGGSITTAGTGTGTWGLDGSHGIFAGAAGSGNSSISHTGGTVTTGGAVAHGLYGVSNTGNVTIINGADGQVTASGIDADGIRATLVQTGAAAIQVGGTVTGGAGNAAGVATNATTSNIEILEGSVVTAQSAIAIHAKGTLLDPSTSQANILSRGTLAGDILTVTGNDVIELTGASVTNGNISTSDGNDALSLSGQLKGDINLGQGDDVLELTSSSITEGNIITSDGNDTLGLSGQLTGDVALGQGDDSIEFAPSSTTSGAVSMDDAAGFGSDRAIVRSDADISELTLLDGGDDVYTADNFIDRLTFDGGEHTINADIIQNWEQISLLAGANLEFAGSSLKTGSGRFEGESLGLTIGAGSALSFQNSAFNVIGDLSNAGTLSLQNGVAGDRLTLTSDPLSPQLSGIYTGQSGVIRLDTFLGGSNSPSDRFVLDGGRSDGTTGLIINRTGGNGAKTHGDGIMVVEALNGATTAAQSFELAQPVGVGAYDYNLFQGGEAAGTFDNWYLRSARNPRVEVFSNQLAPLLAYEAGITQLGTFHERTGGKSVIGAYDGNQTPVWSRTFGKRQDLTQGSSKDSATVGAADYEGRTVGTQLGIDLFGHETADSSVGRFGIFGTYSYSSGDTARDINATAEFDNVKFNSTAIGAYYTFLTPQDAYVDLVGMTGWIDGHTRSDRGLGNDIDGTYHILSAETGQKFALNDGWSVTPQAQLIWQSVQLDDTFDMISSIHYEDVAPFTGRLGLRFDKQSDNKDLLFYASADLWHRFGERDGAVFFDEDQIDYKLDKTSVKLASGITFAIDTNIKAFAEVNYEHAVSGDKSSAFGGQLGLRVNF